MLPVCNTRMEECQFRHATGMQHPHGEGKAKWEASPLHQRIKGQQAALLTLPLPAARMKAAMARHTLG